MDDLIKLLQNLIANKPKPKGGIADSAEGVEFIGKQLSKKQLKEYELINTRVTDPSGLSAITIRNVGRDNRYMYMRDFNDDFTGQFEDVIKFLQDNPDVRLTQAQKDNILYNLGVYRRVNTEKAKLEKGIIEQGKNPDEIYKKSNEERPIQELSFTQALERMLKITEDMKAKAKETDDIFAPQEVSPERKLRIKRLYDGPGYDDPNSAVFRGLGSKYLPMLHEKGIIKLDDQIYQNLKQGKHHWGGAMYNAPDPVRIWRYHFGNEVFDKMNKWNYNNDDVFKWIEQNNIQPIKREGPTNALEYLTPTEIQQNLSDELSAFKKYKNPEQLDENSRKFFYADKPDQRMERITYHGENIQGYETALQKMDPEAYNKYAAEFRQKTNDANVIPFNKNKDIYEQAQDLKSFEKDVIDTLYAPIKPDLKIVKSDKKLFEDAKTKIDESASKAGEGKFTKAQVLIERLKNTIKENPNDKYVQETFPGFIKEIEAKPELADNPNVQEAFGLTDLSETADQRLVEYSDGTLDFYTKGNQGGMESVQALIDELGISQDEALRIKQLEPEDQILEITKLRTLKNKPEKAKGGRVNFNQGSGLAGAGLGSLTPYQKEYYNDKIIRDNMDFIREDMRLYFDEDNRSDFQKFIDSLTRDDVYDEYDERKGYTGMFKENFTTKDGKDITIPYKPDRNLDIQGLLQLFDESDRGVSSSDETIFNSSDILGKFSSKEREV